MLLGTRSWQEELEVVDRVMKAISRETDPESLVNTYFEGVSDLLPIEDYLSLSRRNVPPGAYRITRYSRFSEEFIVNPWTHGDVLPVLRGGLLGEIAYADRPVIIENIPERFHGPDDPSRPYLEPFQTLVALPQYDGGKGLNIMTGLWPPGVQVDLRVVPMLHWQGGLFGRGTHNLVLKNQLAGALAALDRELQSVGEIQRSLLPETLPHIPGFDLAAFYRTSARAGGDYYDFFPLEDGRWGIFIADVSGHGTPAAVLMAITHALAHAKPHTHTPPVQMLTHLNRQLTCTYTRNGTFITAFYAVLDPSTHTLTYSLAGHNPPRLVRGGQVIALDREASLPLGIELGHAYGEATVQLEAGDLLLLYTDGITEAVAPPEPGVPVRELWGVERLDAHLLTCAPTTNASDCIASVRQAVAQFTQNADPTDDQTLIALRVQRMSDR